MGDFQAEEARLNDGFDTELREDYTVLAMFTVAWSFDEPVTVEISCVRIWTTSSWSRSPLPTRPCLFKKVEAQQLYAGLKKGQISPQWHEAHILAETGWIWEEYKNTPEDVIHRLMLCKLVRNVA